MMNLILTLVATLTLNANPAEIPTPVECAYDTPVAVAQTVDPAFETEFEFVDAPVDYESEPALAPAIVAYELSDVDRMAEDAGYDVLESETVPDALRIYVRTQGSVTERIFVFTDHVFWSTIDTQFPELGGACCAAPIQFDEGRVVVTYPAEF